ncbi:c [Asticcacaulis sp. AC460]|uniref:zeta toxin family protein n=1 Tax=Asticcacaulis sp. AC460 TaxID=1282360 RepID=UPI0003C3EB3B|nr:zeta toxin family protein [Asticcacaulis sp. AC460]ESQ90008.1 c [Asticcacaulis sp. AC460] [Asticcacaulis sp. AC460]
MPRCFIIAGPNGAGKTTFALKYLPRQGVETFLNADMIASGLSPFAPEKQAAAAGRLFLEQIEKCIAEGRDFAFETTLSGRAYLKLIERLQASGWAVELIYLALPSADMSISRVAERVAHGGHHIPSTDIIRRYPRSLRNLLNDYSMKVDECHCYLNTEFLTHLIFERYGQALVIRDRDVYLQLESLAGLN